jgi:hypothetical protein
MSSNGRYSLRWTNGDRIWWHVWSFPCVSDARDYAVEHAPSDATHFSVTSLASRHDCLNRALDGGD